MKIKVEIKQLMEVNIKTLLINAPVHYGDEDIPYDFPGRDGDNWKAEIDIDLGKIRNWPQGREEDMFLTVKDAGSYFLYSEEGKEIARIEQDYVPNDLIPGEYGDVIQLDIAADGKIKNWKKNPGFGEFFNKGD